MGLSETVQVAIIGGFAAVASTIIAFFGGKGSATAQMQTSLNDGMKNLLALMKAENLECEKKLEQLRGEINGMQQYQLSLMNALRRAGIDVPRYRPVEVVYLPVSQEEIIEEQAHG